MKKLMFIAAFASIAFGAFSQTFGLKGGINVANQAWKYQGTKINSEYRTGALIGASMNLEQSEKLSTQLELSYSQMGFGKTRIDGEEIPEGDFKYAKIGFAVKYHPVRAANVHAGAELGFQFDKVKDLKYLANPDFGFFFGAEYYFIPYVGIGGRYYLGISDVNSGGSDSSGNTLKQLNRAFQVYLAFRLPSKQLKENGF